MALHTITRILRGTRAVLAIFLLACTQHIPEPEMLVQPKAGASEYSFLSLGDSYTIGESVSAADRWSVQLAGLLRRDGIDLAAPDLIARTGWTTSELQTAIQATGNQETYSLVSLLIGVNNQYRGQSPEQYRTEFRDLLQTATRFAGGKASRVFVLSIPDWGASPYAAGRNSTIIAQEIDLFNAVAREECQKASIAFVDITLLTRSAAGDDSQFASDGLHYSGRQMRQWAQKAVPVVKELLRK
ncbi:SGNH/GDSL hydrolase family protein [Spirosoma koreense]